MEILELHFNPQAKKDTAYESFCYEPENDQEKKMGAFFIVAELKDHFRSNYKIIENLASLVKEEYYANGFKKAIKKASDFLLEKEAVDNNNWLENINLAMISLTPLENEQAWQINLTQKGNIKIIISREKEIMDIGENLGLQKFSSGDLIENDKIMILTEEVLNFFKTNNLLEKFSEVSKKKEVTKLLGPYQESLKEISGIFLFIIVKPLILKTKKIPDLKFASDLKSALPALKLPSLKLDLSFLENISAAIHAIRQMPQRISESFNSFKLKIKNLVFNRKNLVVVFFIIILIIGSFIFKKAEENKQIEQERQSLEEIKQKISQAETFLIIKDEAKANQFLQEAWQEISFFENQEKLKETIKAKLYSLNKIEEIKQPTIAEDFDKDKFSEPITYKLNVYSLDAEQGRIIRNNKTWAESDLLVNAKSIAVDGSVWILDKENKILRFYTGQYQNTINLDFFPKIENALKIFTTSSLSAIYILEPSQKRVIVINKKGEIMKQLISEKFDNLQDIYVTKDPENIYLLNNDIVY